MKLLTKLEKNTIFWILVSISILFFFLRLPSLIEPNWYGDEGIYQTMGQAINRGRLLYVQIWDNKPPLLYIVYAFFAGEQFLVRLFSLITGLFTVLAIFFFSEQLFKNLKASIFSTTLFAILFAIPLLEGNIANAENFMLLPVILAGTIIYKISIKNHTPYAIRHKLFSAGLLLGIAFLFKIVAIFDFASFFLFFIFVKFKDSKIINIQTAKRQFISLLPNLLSIITGFLIPLLATFAFFAFNHAVHDFTQAVFFSNVGYVGYGNRLIIPQGFLILKLMLLALTCIIIFWKRKQINPPTIFLILWFAFSLFNTFFSGRPYTHYALVSLPVFCLLIGSVLSTTKLKPKFFLLIILVGGLTLIISTFKPNYKKSVRYYDNAISFLSGKKSVESYQSFFDHKTPRDYELASFIKTHTSSTDEIFIWGNSAQIYALSNKQPIVKYTVAYHITQYPYALQDAQIAINIVKPKYIITLKESSTIPFYMPSYVNKFVLKNAVIYERTF